MPPKKNNLKIKKVENVSDRVLRSRSKNKQIAKVETKVIQKKKVEKIIEKKINTQKKKKLDEEYDSDENESDNDSDYKDNNNKIKKRKIISKKIKNEEIDIKYEEEKSKESENEKIYPKTIPKMALLIRKELEKYKSVSRQNNSKRYFRTNPGEYAEGDQFIGATSPEMKGIRKLYSPYDFESIYWLITSPIHEERTLGIMSLVDYLKIIENKEIKNSNKKKTNTKLDFYNKEKDSINVIDEINKQFKKYKCNSIPELIKSYVSQDGWMPGKRTGWDIQDIEAVERRQKEKLARIGESRPIFFDKIIDEKGKESKNEQYEYKANLKLKNEYDIQKLAIIEIYIELMPWIDNWDLIDISCADVIGILLNLLSFEQGIDLINEWTNEKIGPNLYGGIKQIKESKNDIKDEKNNLKRKADEMLNDNDDNKYNTTTMWTNRVSIICAQNLIKSGEYRYTIFVAEKLLKLESEERQERVKQYKAQLKDNNKVKANIVDMEDLIQKALGWMLREIGKQDTNTLKKFLDKYSWYMPRTMLRYAIEKLSNQVKTKYMNASGPL